MAELLPEPGQPVRPGRRFFFRLLVWLVISVIGFWALRSVPFRDLWLAFTRIQPAELALWVGVNAALLLLIASRWYLILRAQGYAVPFLPVAGYRVASIALTMFTPGMQLAGDALLIRLAQKRHAVPAAGAISSVALDRVTESFSNYLLLGGGSLLVVASGVLGDSGFEKPLAALAVLSALGMGAYLAVLRIGWRPLTLLLRQVLVLVKRPAYLIRLAALAVAAESQMGEFSLRHPRVLLSLVVLSGFQWAGQLADYALAAHFLGFDLSLMQVISTVTFSRLAFMAPVPGALGALEASQVFLMQAMGLGPGAGISFTLLLRGRDAVVGGLGLALAGLFYR